MAFFMSPRGTLIGTAKDFKARRAGFSVSGSIAAHGKTVAQLHEMYSAIDGILQTVVDELVNRQKSAYGAGGHQTHGGRTWAPLAASTLERKAKEGGPLDILIDTAIHGGGRLRDSIHKQNTKAKKTARGLSYAIRIVADAPVGRFHATGWSGPRGSGPPRPPVEHTPADVELVTSKIRNALATVKGQS